MIHKKGSLERSYILDHLLAGKISAYFSVIIPTVYHSFFSPHTFLLSFTCEILQSNGKSDRIKLWRYADTVIFENETQTKFNPGITHHSWQTDVSLYCVIIMYYCRVVQVWHQNRWLHWDFPTGFYNWVFQFISIIQPVINKTGRYFDILFYNTAHTDIPNCLI